MPPSPHIAELDDHALDELYDPGAISRGRAYALEGRIKLMNSPPGSIRAVCRGSGRSTYLVDVKVVVIDDATFIDDECSCPLGGGCKHCVAAILTARGDRGARPGASVAALTPRSDWRQELAGLAVDDAVGPVKTLVEPTMLGLQFSIVRPSPSRYLPTLTPSVRVRPMREGKNKRWVKTGAAWRDIASPYSSPYGSPNYDELQVGALRSLATSLQVSYYSSGPDPSVERARADIWHHLERADELGLSLVGDGQITQVAVSPDPAQAIAELTADEHGTLTLRAFVTIDGAPLPPLGTEFAMIGSPPHGMWMLERGLLSLVPFDRPLHPAVARLVNSGPLVVAAHDADELLDLYVPDLHRQAKLSSPDGSVDFQLNRFDRLVLHVERRALDETALWWAARYRRGERVTEHALMARTGRSRDHAAEVGAAAALDLPTDVLAELAHPSGLPRDLVVRGNDNIALFAEVLPHFEADPSIDVVIDDVDELPALREAVEDPTISLTVRDGDAGRDGNDWFDLDVSVTVDGEDVDFVPLFAALHQGDEALILPTGTWLRLDRPELHRLRELIEEARGLVDAAADATARVNRFQADWWGELSDLGVVTEQSERWGRQLSQMAELSAPERVTPPPGLAAELRPYQQEGFDWLAFLHRHGLGGVLADDMGLGKTVQTLALCLHIHDAQPDARFLVVAPTSVVENWAREAQRFAPDLRVRTIRETQSRRGTTLASEIEGAQLVVTSYALFRLEFEQYAQHAWELLLLDEAQFVKNHTGKTYQCTRRLDAATKIAITGTPLENTLMDLWSLLSITAPGLYPDPKRFSETYRKPIEKGTNPELLSTLRRRIAPLMRRRTKDAVLTELPPKIEQTIEIDLSAKHARIYATQLQRQRQKVLGLVGDVTRHRFEILKSLTLLRQLALDPGLIDEANDVVGSAKLDRLVEDLTQVVAEGHRALVFSQFTRFLGRARARLDTAGIAYSYLDGRTRNREKAIAKFKDGDCPVFLISLKAGGFGLNLTEADYCFVLDPWWNPATETQAVDRAHRIGQQNPVVVYRYVSAETIEEKVMELKAKKSALFDSVVGDEAALSGALSEDDIRSLLDLG